MSRLTLMGMLNYNPTLLDGLIVPGCNAEMVRTTIISKMGDLYPYYQVPDVLKKLITTWSLQYQMQWGRMYQTMTKEYEPLENYDRYEDWSDSGNAKTDAKTSYSNTGTSENSTNSKTETQVSAFNESTYQPDSKMDGSGSDNGKTTDSGTSTNGITGSNDSTHSGHIHGNIGVTTSAQMAAEEWELRATHNLLDHVCKMFEQTFMVQVY